MQQVSVGWIILCFLRATAAQEAHVLVSPDGTCPEGSVPLCEMLEMHVKRCLRRQYVCDGVQHCPHGEDENYAGCKRRGEGMYNEPHLFRNTAIHESTDCSLPFYPDVCVCSHSTKLYCDHGRLHYIPRNISSNLTHLYVHANNIRLRSDDLSALTNLTILNLNSNGLQEIPKGFFYNQNRLYRLLMRDNSLSHLDDNMFSSARQITMLMLDGNKLREIPAAIISDLSQLVFLNLSRNEITLDGYFFPASPLKYLEMADNKIEAVTRNTFSGLQLLRKLILSHNSISFIDEMAFNKNALLDELDLSANQLVLFDSRWFHPLKNLNLLKIGYNPMSELPINAFQQNNNLTNIYLDGLIINNIDVKMWRNLPELQSIVFAEFAYCSYVPLVKYCSPSSDGVSSSRNLLATRIHRIVIWLIAVVTVTANITVLCTRWLTPTDDTNHLRILISNLAIADLLMGLYLVIIAYKDLQYRDDYNSHALSWMHSYLCTISGVIAITSSEVAVLILTYMSVERFLVIVYPLTQTGLVYRSSHSTALWMMATWCIGLVLSLLPVCIWESHSSFYGLNGVCLPLHVQQPYTRGWQYSAAVFIVLNVISVMTVCVMYAAMFINIQRTRRNTTMLIKEMDVAIRFFCIAATDSFCWLPIATIKLAALAGVLIPDDVHAWIVVFVLPINSAVNPLLYTLSTTHFYNRVRSSIQKLTNKKSGNMSGSEANQTTHRTSLNILTNAPGLTMVCSNERATRVSLTTSNRGKGLLQPFLCTKATTGSDDLRSECLEMTEKPNGV